VTHAWATPGDYVVNLRAYNPSQPVGVSATVVVHVVNAVYYVSAQSANPVVPYSSWTTAARSIQDAVDAAGVVGALVLVGDGTYSSGGRAVGVGSLLNRLVVAKPVRVQSLNGPLLTIIQGQQVPGITNGDGAIRCVYLASGTSLSGFTLTNGATRNAWDYPNEQLGGGVYCESLSAIVSNCMILGNSAQYSGGGASGGTLNNCVLSGNSTQNGGGVNGAMLNNCMLTRNSASYSGGGAFGGTLNNCVLSSNSAQYGGGANGSTLNNCTLSGNAAQYNGGGAYSGTLNNCVLIGNSALTYGGGAISSSLNNCTVNGNSAQYGGGVSDATLNNSIIYFNTASQQGSNYYSSFWNLYPSLNFCCTAPLPTNGVGNISGDPLLENLATGDLRLQANSPCIDAGTNSFVVGDTDLDGNPRVTGSAVDIGAYEFQINAPPVITAQPQGLTVPANATFVLTVVARGTPPFYYKWQRQGVDLIEGDHVYGVNAATLILSNVLGADAGAYSVLVTNSYGNAQSHPASLVVLDPFILIQPSNVVAKLGDGASLQVTAVGTPPLTYTWRKDGTPLAGALQPLLSLTNLVGADAGDYDVVVTNVYGSVTSSVATLHLDVAVTDSFNPGVAGGSFPGVYCLCIQPDGKILVAGSFTTLAGQTRTNLGRLNPDGTLDSTFDAQIAGGDFPAVNSVVVEPNGDILVGGRFTSLSGQSRANLGRLHSDGTVDANFNPGASGTVVSFTYPEVDCIALGANGQILIGGTFNTLAAQKRLCLGRLHSDGTLDDTFNPGADYVIQALTVQPDGRILVSGKFTTLAGKPVTNIGRVKADGTFDDSFNVLVSGGGVVSMAVQSDAKLLLAGTFESLNGQARKGLGRLNSDGSIDQSFNPAITGTVWCIAQQADGRILAGGIFLPIAGRTNPCLVRLTRDGSLDDSFNPQVSGTLNPQSTPAVFSLALQDDGKLLVGGSFTNLSGQPRNCIGRLLTLGDATQSLSFTPSTISWIRGGTGPEVWSTTFDYSTNGVNWSGSLAGTRTTNGWQVSGLVLPPQTKVRARGLVAGGYGGRSGWFVEASSGGAPQLRLLGFSPTGFSMMFDALPGIAYDVEYRDSLTTGAWRVLEHRAGSGEVETVTDTAGEAAIRFYRLRGSWSVNQQNASQP
jgi:uncharacterized delta-60 repeat protein